MDILIHTNFAIGERVWFEVEDRDDGTAIMGTIVGISYFLGKSAKESLKYTIIEDGNCNKHHIYASVVHKAFEAEGKVHTFPPYKKKAFIQKLLHK